MEYIECATEPITCDGCGFVLERDSRYVSYNSYSARDNAYVERQRKCPKCAGVQTIEEAHPYITKQHDMDFVGGVEGGLYEAYPWETGRTTLRRFDSPLVGHPTQAGCRKALQMILPKYLKQLHPNAVVKPIKFSDLTR